MLALIRKFVILDLTSTPAAIVAARRLATLVLGLSASCDRTQAKLVRLKPLRIYRYNAGADSSAPVINRVAELFANVSIQSAIYSTCSLLSMMKSIFVEILGLGVGMGTCLQTGIATYGAALAAVVVAVLLRWTLDPFLGNDLPLVTLFGAVAVAVWIGGYRPALLAVALGYLACQYFFIEPRGSFAFQDLPILIGLFAYLISCFIIIGFGEAIRFSQRQLAEEKERLRTTLASIGDAVISSDMDGRITNLNPVAESLTGWKTSEAMGQPLESVFRIINEETRQPVENPALRALREGIIVGLANHTLLIHKDGSERPIDDSAAPIRCKVGELVGCVLVFRDVTERRSAERALQESEERLRLAQRIAKIGTFEWDIRTGVNTWTPELEAMYGLPPGGFAGTQQTWEELVHPEDRPHAVQKVQEAMAGGEFVDEWRVVWPDGSVHWFAGRGYVFNDEKGSPLRLLGINIDITDRKQAEEALREADRRKDEFLATLAHELRNPLAPIRNALSILNVSADPDRSRNAREIITRQVTQMVRLVDDLLDVSRISRGRLDLRKERVELTPIIKLALETCRPMADCSSHNLTATLAEQPIFVDADPVRLAQVFSNLLNNSCKFTKDGGKITLTSELQGSNAVVTVKDNGIGIPPDKIDGIFDLFSQVDRTLEKSEGGLGIGLTLAKRLVALHNGSIEVRSEGLGKGCEVVVCLPIVIEQPPAAVEPAIEVPASGSRRVLVVDDNRDGAESLAILLGLTGDETFLAYDGEEALEVADNTRPDVILLDIGLPKLNGYEVCRRLRKKPWAKSALIIALTGWGQEDDRRKSSEAGFDGHMVKPVDYDAFQQLLSELQAEKAS